MATFSEKHDVALNIATYLKDHPWAEEYNGLDTETLLKYLEISYLDSNGQPFPRNENFYDNVISAILNETIPPQQANQQVPPHFASLLVDFVKKYEDKKNQGLKKKSKIISLISTDPKAAIEAARKQALHYWELQRQEILLKEIQDKTNENSKEISQELTAALSSKTDFVKHKTTNPNLIDHIINSYSNKIITNKAAESSKLLEEAVKEELEKIIPFQEAADLTYQTVGKSKIPDAQNEKIARFSKTARDLDEANKFSESYKKLLKDKLSGNPINQNQEFESAHWLAQYETQFFAGSLIDALKKAGFSDQQIDQNLPHFVDNILFSTAESPFVSELIYSPKSFDDFLTSTVENTVKTHFNPQGLRSYVPFLNKRIAAAEKKRFSELISDVKNQLKAQPSLPVILKTTAYNTYSTNRNSLEGGDPIGRIPYVIKIDLLGARNPQELSLVVQAIKKQYPDISASQTAALGYLQQQITNFHLQHPNVAKITSLYYRHTLAYGVAKVSVSTLLFHPDYALYVPVYWVNVAKSLYWESKWKPRIIRHVIEKTPIGKIVGLWYHENDWGMYENPLDHLKHKAEKFVLKKGISLVGHATSKIGTLLNNSKIISLSKKILSPEFIGKVAGAWIIGADIIKKTLKYVGLGIGAIFFWAVSYGIPGLIGFGLSFGAGIAAGIKMGLIASAIGGPIVGVVVGAITTLVVTFLGTGLTAWLLSHGLIPTSLGGLGISTTSAGGLTNLTTSFASAALPITGVFLGTTIGANFLYYNFLISGFNPYRDTTQASIIQAPKELNDMFQKAASDACLPIAALKAISQTEASGVWGYTPEETAKFSQDGWWNSASQTELERGYCTDTCQKPDIDCAKINRTTHQYCELPPPPICSETTVYGPMQFEEITWGAKYGYEEENLKKRCNLSTSIREAALKIKSGSGTSASDCAGWDEQEVRRAAKNYCGNCGTVECDKLNPNTQEYLDCRARTKPCGRDYCSAVWNLYQEYNK